MFVTSRARREPLAVSGAHLLGKVLAHVTHAIRHDNLDDLLVGQDLEGHKQSLPARCLRMCLMGVRVPVHTGGVELRTARVTSGCQPWTSLVYCAWCCRGCCGCVCGEGGAVVVVVVVAVVAVVVVLPRTSLVADVVGGCACE